MKVLSIRLDPDLELKLNFLLERKKILDKSLYIRQLLDKSLQEDLIDFICNEIALHHISAWKGAELAKISLRQMYHELAMRNIETYDEAAFLQDLKTIAQLPSDSP